MKSIPLVSALGTLLGNKMTSIEFVWDYLQLKFDDSALTISSRPSIISNNVRHTWNEFGFKDILCNVIGCTVVSVDMREGNLFITFMGDFIICIPVEGEGIDVVEAVEFHSPEGIWVA